jgi:spermidine synthase
LKPWIRVDESRAPDGALIELFQRGEEFSLRAAGRVLMTSRTHGSEVQLAELSIQAMEKRDKPHVLVAGLGFGYTLRAVLDRLPAEAVVTVIELMPSVIAFNHAALGPLAAFPLNDPRVRLLTADIVTYLRTTHDNYDAILLDVDNGPQAFTQASNAWLYRQSGLLRIRKRLSPGGVLAVWSVGQDDAFTGQVEASGFDVECHRVRARANGKGDRHAVWVARPQRSGA